MQIQSDNQSLAFALLKPPTPEEFMHYSNSNERSGLLRNRVETSQWGFAYSLIFGVTQYLYYARLKTLELSRSSRSTRFAGFLLLNAMQTVLFTNTLMQTPIQTAQDLNLTREIYFQRARSQYNNP